MPWNNFLQPLKAIIYGGFIKCWNINRWVHLSSVYINKDTHLNNCLWAQIYTQRAVFFSNLITAQTSFYNLSWGRDSFFPSFTKQWLLLFIIRLENSQRVIQYIAKTVAQVVTGLEAIYSNHYSHDMMSASRAAFYTGCGFMGNWQLWHMSSYC